MRVLAVVDSITLGGAEALLATLAGAAPQAGLELDVVSVGPPHPDRSQLASVLRAAGIEPRYLSIPRLAHPNAIPALARAIRASRCDVVHAHLEYAATLVPPAARIVARPAVCTFHHIAAPLARRDAVKERLAVEVASRSRGVIFVSEASRRSFAERYGDRSRWMVVHNGVDLARFRPEAASMPTDLGVPDGAPVATMVAALRPGKGHVAAIEAWSSVTASCPSARLLLVGSGPLEPALRARASALGVADSIVFAGLRSDVDLILRASSVVVLPSESEALPTSLMEAAACGRPVVATPVGGVGEVVSDGSTGLLVPVGDRRALAEALGGLLVRDARWHGMGAAARRIAEERFDRVAWARRLAVVYAEAVAGTSRPGGPISADPPQGRP